MVDAWNSARDDVRKTLVGERMAAVYALLGDDMGSRKWLLAACSAAVSGYRAQIGLIIDSLESEVPKHQAVYNSAQAELPFGMTFVGFRDSHLNRRKFRGPEMSPEEYQRISSFKLLSAHGERMWYGGLIQTDLARSLVHGLQELQDTKDQLVAVCVPLGFSPMDLGPDLDPRHYSQAQVEERERWAKIMLLADFDPRRYEPAHVEVYERWAKIVLDSLVWVDLHFG
jgi:hypothetical protein